MRCPNCYESLPWYASTVMTRWTPVRCRRCQSRVNRQLNAKAWLISLLWFLPAFVATQFSWALAFGVLLPCGLVIDHFFAPLCVEADEPAEARND